MNTKLVQVQYVNCTPKNHFLKRCRLKFKSHKRLLELPELIKKKTTVCFQIQTLSWFMIDFILELLPCRLITQISKWKSKHISTLFHLYILAIWSWYLVVTTSLLTFMVGVRRPLSTWNVKKGMNLIWLGK